MHVLHFRMDWFRFGLFPLFSLFSILLIFLCLNFISICSYDKKKNKQTDKQTIVHGMTCTEQTHCRQVHSFGIKNQITHTHLFAHSQTWIYMYRIWLLLENHIENVWERVCVYVCVCWLLFYCCIINSVTYTSYSNKNKTFRLIANLGVVFILHLKPPTNWNM